jgi:hypothetical protein
VSCGLGSPPKRPGRRIADCDHLGIRNIESDTYFEDFRNPEGELIVKKVCLRACFYQFQPETRTVGRPKTAKTRQTKTKHTEFSELSRGAVQHPFRGYWITVGFRRRRARGNFRFQAGQREFMLLPGGVLVSIRLNSLTSPETL